MNRIVLSTTLTLAAFTPFAMRGQDVTENPNRFSFGPSIGLNFKADFNNNAVNPGPAAAGAAHIYNDGYVLVDSSGNAGSLTTYWGYQNASQTVGNTMQFHAIQSGSASFTGDPQYGAEFIYQRVIGNLPFLSGVWGFEAGFGFTELDLRENLGGTVPVTTDAYQLNGLAPGSGYNGTFAGSGNLLGDTPARTSTSATLTGYQKLSGQLFSLRLGPFAEWKFTDKFSLAASVGLTLAPAMVDYDFSETAVLAGGAGTVVSSGHSSKTKLLYGPYVGAMLNYDFNKRWGVYVGARFQNLTDLNQSVGGRTARLDPGATIFATAGVIWKF
jgi:hypothetical protein